jgi:peptide/nickel transport system permease protein
MSTDANSLDALKAGATDAAEVPKESLTTYVPFYKRVLAQPQGKIGLIITVIVVVLALCGPLLLPWATGNTATEFVVKPFSPYGLFGSDNLGRDVLSRFIAGGLTLIVYAVLATVLGMVVGALVGMLAAYIGGRFDAIIMRLNDVILAIPQLVFALLAITVLGPQGWVLVTVIGLTHAPRIARVARSATLGVITEDYIKAAEMYAMPRWKMLLRELLPNITGPLSVEAGLRLTYSIGYIASLSFLGLGLQPPAADWGLMINENRIALSIQPWGVLLPVIAIALLTIGTNLLADSFARATASTSVEA